MEHKTVWVHHPFLPREILGSVLFLRLVAGLLKSQAYRNIGFDRLECAIPRHLLGLFEPLLIAAGANPVRDLEEMARRLEEHYMYRGDLNRSVPYSCLISHLFDFCS